jgi:4,5-DOPA dioxygenase extradiol
MPLLGAEAKDHVYPFTLAFNNATVLATISKRGLQREEEIKEIFKREDLRFAHPTLEHLMPLAVCVGAAGEDGAECLFKTVEYGALGWASFCFGGSKDEE